MAADRRSRLARTRGAPTTAGPSVARFAGKTTPDFNSKGGVVGRLDNKVAFITGAARGQGRNHAVALAREGADIIAIDICEQIASVDYPLGTEDDLKETVRLVEREGRHIIATKADVRDEDALRAAVDAGVERLGRLDIVIANAGIVIYGGNAHQLDTGVWNDVVGVNQTGVWLTCKVAVPHILAHGQGGSVVVISSAAGLHAFAGVPAYVTAKTGLVGLTKAMALELGSSNIRVNSIHPTQVDTPMIMHEGSYRLFLPDAEHPTRDDFAPISQGMHVMPHPWVEMSDVSNAILFLVSDEGRYITGAQLPVDLGADLKA
jgi:(+)-trans-carveol dehydrogenase